MVTPTTHSVPLRRLRVPRAHRGQSQLGKYGAPGRTRNGVRLVDGRMTPVQIRHGSDPAVECRWPVFPLPDRVPSLSEHTTLSRQDHRGASCLTYGRGSTRKWCDLFCSAMWRALVTRDVAREWGSLWFAWLQHRREGDLLFLLGNLEGRETSLFWGALFSCVAKQRHGRHLLHG